jgi:sterol desaturase/sphingolipid hydroxylase (fatty acid hydroxylase superfamily)
MAEPFPGGGQQFVHTRGHPASLALGEEVAGPIYSRACENPGVDLTAVATPGYFGSMGLENWLLKRRAERIGPTAADYERGDTLANLAMGTASLFIPMATHAIADKIAPQRSKTGKGILALAATAAVATTVADRMVRRHRQGAAPAPPPETAGDDPVVERARLVARYGGPTAVVAGAVALTSAVGSATRPKRVWNKRRSTRDLGTGVLAAIGTIAAWDFIYYWNHRLMHEARYLWAIHVVHHSSERFNLSTALRQPVADSFGTFVPYSALCYLGVRPSLIEQARGVNLLYQFWIHTDLIPKLGRLEELFNTASHHRVHHGRNRRYIDRNHGSILILWDRLFGTFEREDDAEPVIYGLTKNIHTDNPVTIATHEYKDILRDVADSDNWADRLSFVVRGPGWAYARRAELDADPTHPSHEPATAGVA